MKPSSRFPAAAAEQSKESELSGDDTSSTDASEGKGLFDVDALPDEGLAPPLTDDPRCTSSKLGLEVADEPLPFPRQCAEECPEDSQGHAASFMSMLGQLEFKEGTVGETDASGIELSAADYASQGCGFDFDDLPTLPSTFIEPPRRGAAHRAGPDKHAAERLPREGANVSHGTDDLPRSSVRESEALTDSTRSSASSFDSVKEGVKALQPLPMQRRTFQSKPKATSLRGRVAIVATGSLGDLQPFVALAQQLELLRHTVRIFTNSNLVDFCTERNLDAVPAFADSKAVMNSSGGCNKHFAQCMTGSQKATQTWIAEHRSDCHDFEDSLRNFRPQVCVCGALAAAACYMYEAKTGVRAIPVYLSYDAVLHFLDFANPTPPRPCILAVSPFAETRVLAPCPSASFSWTDEFVLHEVPSGEEFEPGGRLEGLRRFLVDGKPPVAMGWGSMVASGMTPVEMLGLALRALRGAAARGIILGGWADLDGLADKLLQGGLPELGEDADELADFAAANVFFVSSAPHEWLFPQCRSVVHHGGVGTWQAAIRAGKPSIITPIFADQFSHSAAVSRMGLGIGFKSLPEVEAHELANAITLVEAKRSAAAAEVVGRKMRAKVGERDAASIIDDYLQKSEKAKREGASKIRAL